VALAGQVSVGFWLSTTVKVSEQTVAMFPEESVLEKVTVLDPRGKGEEAEAMEALGASQLSEVEGLVNGIEAEQVVVSVL